MITVPAHRVRQFGMEFFQACFPAADVRRLVRFEVLSYEGQKVTAKAKRKRASRSGINWEVLEQKIGRSEAAFQRPLIKKKIEELIAYYRDCQEQQNLPAIPGAVIMIAERPLTFSPSGPNPRLGLLQIPEEPGILRVLDGQHRLVALDAASEDGEVAIDVPAVIFDALDPRQIIEMFVTINAKHTRLNPSLLLSLAGRRLYTNPDQALAHDVIRKLNEDASSPLAGQIRILGVGKGTVSQASLAGEMVRLFEMIDQLGGRARRREFEEHGRRFFLNYLKAIEHTFPQAWAGRKYSIKTGTALRAFIRVVPDVMGAVHDLRRDPYDLSALKQALAPWGERLGDRRFETEGEWRTKQAGGTHGTVEILTRELHDALRAR
ncbi:MAG: DGQHR domain-containing protein [candidate division NC10 bacterium]|nr:DGQHR domain-containing protein [candidate division NC10 bacterium]